MPYYFFRKAATFLTPCQPKKKSPYTIRGLVLGKGREKYEGSALVGVERILKISAFSPIRGRDLKFTQVHMNPK